MTNEEKYASLLRELGELLETKNNTILANEYTIQSLREAIKAAEEERDFIKKNLAEITMQYESTLAELTIVRKDLKARKEGRIYA